MLKTPVLKVFLMLFYVNILLGLYSCGKETMTISEEQVALDKDNITSSSISLPSENITLQLEVKEGRLVFDNIEHLSNTLTYLSDNEKRHFTREALDKWEQSIGFRSVRNEYEEITDKLENVKSEQDFQLFKVQHANEVTFDEDDFPQSKVFGALSYITENKFSSYFMGNELHALKGNLQITIPSNLINMLPEIYKNPTNFEGIGVHTFNIQTTSPEVDMRGSCSSSFERKCSNEESKKRVSGHWLLQVLVGNAKPGDNNQLVRERKLHYKCVMTSKKKRLWWVKNHNDDIEWGTGWGAQYDMPNISTPCTNYTHKEVCGGTGWTQNSWQIIYTLTLEDWYEAPAFGLCTIPLNMEFLYNNNFVQNNNVDKLLCEDDCWDRLCQ